MRRTALCGQRCALTDAEAVLLIGDDKPERLEGNVAGQERVRSENQLGFAGGDGFLDAALFGGGHGAGQENGLDREARHERAQGCKMLPRQNFRRYQKRRLQAVFRRAEGGCCGDHGLAAADIALHQTVHRAAGGHVPKHVPDRALLRAGQTEGERGLKGVRAGNVTGNGAFVTAHVAEHLQSGGENEEFLENKARPRLHQSLARGWRVDGLIGELHAAELIFRPDGFRENIRKCAETGVECLPDGLLQDVVGKPSRQRIDRHEPPGDASGVLRGLENRILHLARRLLLQRAEEAVGLAVMERGG